MNDAMQEIDASLTPEEQDQLLQYLQLQSSRT
jgi:iron only hydrogenase large subunit-like protein